MRREGGRSKGDGPGDLFGGKDRQGQRRRHRQTSPPVSGSETAGRESQEPPWADIRLDADHCRRSNEAPRAVQLQWQESSPGLSSEPIPSLVSSPALDFARAHRSHQRRHAFWSP